MARTAGRHDAVREAVREAGREAGREVGREVGRDRLAVLQLEPVHWRILRDLRLRALEQDGPAFLGGLAEERRADEPAWRARFRGGRWLLGGVGGSPVALIALVDYPDEDPRLHLESMWVAPSLRRTGVGRELLRHAERVARSLGRSALGTWVFDHNEPARRLYVSHGYRPTGRRGPVPDGRFEVEYARDLRPPVRTVARAG